MVSEPGYCAQFYPTANCNNEGPGNPLTDPNWRRDLGAGAQSRRRTRPLALSGSDQPGIGRNPKAQQEAIGGFAVWAAMCSIAVSRAIGETKGS